MRTEHVRHLLPELAEPDALLPAGVAEHLAECSSCSLELREYRAMVGTLGGLAEMVVEPSPGFVGRVLATIPVRSRLIQVASDRRLILSVGGAMVGAAALGLVWWARNARRAASPVPQRAGASG